MKTLETMTAEQLQRAPYSPVPFLVDELIPDCLLYTSDAADEL